MIHYITVTDEGDIFQVGTVSNLDYVLVDPRYTVIQLEGPFEENPQDFYYDYVDEEIKPRDYPVPPVPAVHVHWIGYDQATGKIERRGFTRSDVILPSIENLGYIILDQQLENMDLWFVDLNAFSLILRPAVEPTISKTTLIADGVDEVVISNLPDFIIIAINGEEFHVEGGELTLTADIPTTYKLAVDHWPFLPWSLTIEAAEA